MGRPFEDEAAIRFIFNDFFKYLKSDEWSINADITHQMLQKVTVVTREKFHVKEDVKRWVYVVDKENFDPEPETQQEVSDYSNKEEESAF